MKNITLLLYLFILFFTSCSLNGYRTKITDEYYLWTMEGKSDMAIYYVTGNEYNIRMIGPCVYAFGIDSDFIIVKKHPKIDGVVRKKSILYYIIPLKNRFSLEPEKNYYGPFIETEYFNKRKELGVDKSLDFTFTFKDLE